MIGTPEYSLAKYLDSYIKPNIPNSFLLNSTSSFINSLNSVSISPSSSYLVSFDIESLFTNIPLDEVCDITCDYVYGSLSNKIPPFDKTTFKKLLKLATSGIFSFNNQLFSQIDGVTMDSPLGPSLANIFLAHLEKNWQ